MDEGISVVEMVFLKLWMYLDPCIVELEVEPKLIGSSDLSLTPRLELFM
jgi:hypothetical protein